MCGEKRLLWLGSVSVFFGLALYAAAIWGTAAIHDALHDGLRSQFILTSPETKGFDDWVEQKEAITYNSVYMFNVTNSEDVVNNGAKPQIVEIGPYVYRKHVRNIDATFIKEPYEGGLHTLSYVEYKWFTFDPVASKGLNDSDVFVQPNLAFWGVYSKVKNTSALVEYLVEALAQLEGDEVYASHTVREIVYGYKDPLLTLLMPFVSSIDSDIVEVQHNYTSEQDARDKAKTTVILTGQDDNPEMAYSYIRWRDLPALSAYWTEPEVITGTDGTHFHLGVTREHYVTTWVDEIYRAQKMVYQKDSPLYGVNLYKFVMEPHSMFNSTEWGPNAKYYQNGPSGVFNISGCPPGAPIFLSKPHWMDADPIYFNMTEGMTPAVREEHETHIDIEPLTGGTYNGHKRMQINLEMEPSPMYTKVPAMMHPIMWIDEHGHFTEHQAGQIKDQIYTAQTIRDVCYYVGWVVGTVLLLIGLPCLYVHTTRSLKRWEDQIRARATGRYTAPEEALLNKANDEFDAE